MLIYVVLETLDTESTYYPRKATVRHALVYQYRHMSSVFLFKDTIDKKLKRVTE